MFVEEFKPRRSFVFRIGHRLVQYDNYTVTTDLRHVTPLAPLTHNITFQIPLFNSAAFLLGTQKYDSYDHNALTADFLHA